MKMSGQNYLGRIVEDKSNCPTDERFSQHLLFFLHQFFCLVDGELLFDL